MFPLCPGKKDKPPKGKTKNNANATLFVYIFKKMSLFKKFSVQISKEFDRIELVVSNSHDFVWTRNMPLEAA